MLFHTILQTEDVWGEAGDASQPFLNLAMGLQPWTEDVFSLVFDTVPASLVQRTLIFLHLSLACCSGPFY
jgi:hypothetical protein